MATARFSDYIARDARNHGMLLRFSFPPYPVVGMTRATLRKYVEGSDPTTGKPLMQELIDALTKPLTTQEKNPVRVQRPERSRLLRTDSEEHLHRLFLEDGWTDGLPSVLPTEERVAEMLTGTSHTPDEVVGQMTVTHLQEKLQYTVEKVAVNAVMAGCTPEYFPIVLAIASTGYASLFSSTNSFAFAMIINGPIRDKLNMNYTIGALGPFAQPNATIGRAWTIISKNLGNGGIPGDTYLGSIGNNLNYNNLVIVENEDASPWVPFHVQKGFKREDNVVSLFRGLGISPGQVARGSCVNENPMFDHQFSDLFDSFTGFFGALIVADPLVARRLVEQGYDSKDKLIDWLYKNTTQTVKDYTERNYSYLFEYPRALKGAEPFATWYKLPDDARIPHFPRRESINIVVTGGQTNAYSQAGNLSYGTSVSIDKWA